MANSKYYAVFAQIFDDKVKSNLLTYLKSPQKNVLCVLCVETIIPTVQMYRLLNALNATHGGSTNPRYFQSKNQLILNWQCVCEEYIDNFPDLTVCELPTTTTFSPTDEAVFTKILEKLKESFSKKLIFVLPEGPFFDLCLKESGDRVEVFRCIPDVYSYASEKLEDNFRAMNVDQPWNQNFDTALLRAASEGNAATVERLVSLGADLNLANIDGNTPLHLATLHGHYHVAETLLDHGAVIDTLNAESHSPLQIAVSNNQKKLIILLSRYQNAKESST